jgi:acyl-CoA thioester hydrolase
LFILISMPEESTKEFSLKIHVQPADIDALGHVNNVVYLRWVQDIAAAHWDKIAPEEMKKKYSWVVLRHEIDYRNPAVLQDELLVRTWVSSCKGVRSVREVKFLHFTTGKVIAETKTTWCLLDTQTLRPRRIEQDIISIFGDKSSTTLQ